MTQAGFFRLCCFVGILCKWIEGAPQICVKCMGKNTERNFMPLTALILTAPFTFASVVMNNPQSVPFEYQGPVMIKTCYQMPHVSNPNGILNDPQVRIEATCDTKLIGARYEI